MIELYQPSDDDMSGLARAIAAMEPDEEWDSKSLLDDEYRAAKEWEADDLAQHPAFQKIIRAAQAKAVRQAAEAADHSEALDLYSPQRAAWLEHLETMAKRFEQ